jgi:hypothetical protein
LKQAPDAIVVARNVTNAALPAPARYVQVSSSLVWNLWPSIVTVSG